MHTISDGIVALDAQAVRASAGLVARARPVDMARPTPCADWTLLGGHVGDQAVQRPVRAARRPAAPTWS